jgi:hypothetical protein
MERLRQIPESSFFHTRAVQVCYATPRPPGSEQILKQMEREVLAFQDPEPRYMQAGLFSSCLGNEFTGRLVKSAIAGGFCAYEYLQTDTLMEGFRKAPEYPAVLAQAKQCQDRFLAGRDQPQH